MTSSKRGEASSGRSDISSDEGLDLYEIGAKYYDLWYPDIEDYEFYRGMAERTGGPILECMCGTGRLLIPLAKEGYDITGFDLSYAMLDRLTAKLEELDEDVQERVHIGHADIRDFSCNRRYKLIFVPLNSFMHLLETEDQEAALRNIADHLDEGGLFCMSLFNPKLDRPEGLMRHRGTTTTPQGEVISKFESQTFDVPRQRTTVHYFYDVSKQDRELRRVTTAVTLRYLFHQEAVELLNRCGLEVVDTYGDHNMAPFRKGSDSMVFVARKSA
jgi:SAM-dependent methyltransferase